LVTTPPGLAQRELRSAAASDVVVTIRSEHSDIRVMGWDGDEVTVRVRGGSTRGIQLSGDRARIRVLNQADEDLEVRVPRGARVDLRSQNGELRVADVTGSVYLETLNGDARVDGEPRLIEAESLSGDITITGRTTVVRANTVSGSIDLPRASGTVDASSTSGDVNVSAEGLERGILSSTSGTVILQGRPGRNASLTLDSASGTIELRLGRDYPADYEIWTVSGDIDNTFGPQPTRLRRGAGTSLRFNTGTGARIRASSVSGSVQLRDE
jgi:DUF4097 and DUF4098 domain-containing protein YvlB